MLSIKLSREIFFDCITFESSYNWLFFKFCISVQMNILILIRAVIMAVIKAEIRLESGLQLRL